MSLGPIEVIVVGFPGNKFNGAVLPELMALVEAGTITVVDGVFITKDAAGDVAFVVARSDDFAVDEHHRADGNVAGRFAGLGLFDGEPDGFLVSHGANVPNIRIVLAVGASSFSAMGTLCQPKLQSTAAALRPIFVGLAHALGG